MIDTSSAISLSLKPPEQRRAEQVKRYVDEYANLTLEAERIKERIDWLKGYFETLASNDLKDTKLQTAAYWGSRNSRVTVTNSATVKYKSLSMVRDVLGRIAGDYIKTETVDKITDPFKKMLAMVCLGYYLEGSIEKTIQNITTDPSVQATLRKKLRGQYEKDRATLMQVAGLPEQEAGDWAYLVTEVMNWEKLTRMLQAAGWKGSPQEAIDKIKDDVIVEEGIKVGIVLEKEF